MKKLLNFITNPIKMIAVGAVFFGLATIDSLIVGASSFGDLSIFGKVAIIPVCAVLVVLFIRFFLIPVGKWIIDLV